MTQHTHTDITDAVRRSIRAKRVHARHFRKDIKPAPYRSLRDLMKNVYDFSLEALIEEHQRRLWEAMP